MVTGRYGSSRQGYEYFRGCIYEGSTMISIYSTISIDVVLDNRIQACMHAPLSPLFSSSAKEHAIAISPVPLSATAAMFDASVKDRRSCRSSDANSSITPSPRRSGSGIAHCETLRIKKTARTCRMSNMKRGACSASPRDQRLLGVVKRLKSVVVPEDSVVLAVSGQASGNHGYHRDHWEEALRKLWKVE
jgi:hypothetical protein